MGALGNGAGRVGGGHQSAPPARWRSRRPPIGMKAAAVEKFLCWWLLHGFTLVYSCLVVCSPRLLNEVRSTKGALAVAALRQCLLRLCPVSMSPSVSLSVRLLRVIDSWFVIATRTRMAWLVDSSDGQLDGARKQYFAARRPCPQRSGYSRRRRRLVWGEAPPWASSVKQYRLDPMADVHQIEINRQIETHTHTLTHSNSHSHTHIVQWASIKRQLIQIYLSQYKSQQ